MYRSLSWIAKTAVFIYLLSVFVPFRGVVLAAEDPVCREDAVDACVGAGGDQTICDLAAYPQCEVSDNATGPVDEFGDPATSPNDNTDEFGDYPTSPNTDTPAKNPGDVRAVTIINPLGVTDPRAFIGRVIRAIISIIGSITLLMFVYGGVLWITSMGEKDKVEKGKKIMVWCVLGLGVIASSYVIVNAVITGLSTGTAT